MSFPVDLLADVGQAELEQSAHTYMENLLFSNPYSPELLTLSDSTQTPINISKVGFAPLYGANNKQKILALFSPSDPLTAVALYLLGRWWTVDDVLKTGDPSRNGAVEVKTIGERIVLYVLNRVIYRAKEMNTDELPFLCHGDKDYAKILWKDGEAVGFYSVKAAGTLLNIASTRRYQIPVMDSIFVRKNQRSQGLGLEMLQDFVLSFKENALGLRYPLPTSMYKVCKKYLCQYPGDDGLLWEVESVGEPYQRTNLSRKIHSMDLSAVSKSLTFTEEPLAITTEVVMDFITTQIKEDGVESTVEIVEEVTATRTAHETEMPVKPQGRSSGIRVEDIEAETPHEKQDVSQQMKEMPVIDSTAEAEAATSMASEDKCDIKSAPAAGQPQTEDDTKHINDSQIIVENVASEIDETNEDSKGSNAEPRFSEEIVEETQTLSNVGEGIVVESTVTTTTITTYTRHYQKQFPESDKVDEVTEEKGVSVSEVAEKLDGSMEEESKESTAMKGDDENSTVANQQELEMEPLTNEIEKDQQEVSVLEESVSVLSDTTEDVGTDGTGVEQGKHEPEREQAEEDVAPDVYDEEVPPVVQRRSLRVRHKIVSKAVFAKGHNGDNANEPNVETEYADTNEKVVEQMKKHPLVDQNTPFDTDKMQKDVTVENINVEQKCVPSAEEAAGSITTVTEVYTEECEVVLEHAKLDTESLLEEVADVVAQESPAVAADPVAEELQDLADTVCKAPKLHQATVVLIDFKLAGPRFAENNAVVETTAQEECPTLDNDQVKVIASEEEQALKTDVMVVVEERDEGTVVNSEEISTDGATEAQIDDKECHNKDTVDTEKRGDSEVPFVDTRVLRSGRKTVTVSKVTKEREEDDNSDSNAEETLAVSVEEEHVCEPPEADSTVPDGRENLSPTETDEELSQEQSQVSTRALRSKTKSATSTPANTKTRRQVRKRGGRDKEEPMTPKTTLRSKRQTFTDTPQQVRKRNQNKEVKVSDLPETEEKSAEVIEEAQHINLETEDKIEQPDDRCDVASEERAADETTGIEKELEVKEVNGRNTEQEVAVPASDSAASEQESEQCASKITPGLLQEEAVEERGHECEATMETEDEEKEKQKSVALREEQCPSSAASVPEEDTNVLVQHDEDALARVEETPNSGDLKMGDSTDITTDKSKSTEMDEDKSTAGEEGAKVELTVGTRKRRRSATTTPRRKSKRGSRQSKKKEREDSTSAEESQEEDPKVELEDIKEESGGEKTKESVENKAEVPTEDGTEVEDQEQEKDVSEDRNTINDPTVETRVLRKRRSAAAATPRRTSKRVRSELKEAPKITVESSEPEDESIRTETITEESPVEPLTALETQPVLLKASEDEEKETSDGEDFGEETATDEGGKAADDEAPSGTQTKEDKHQEVQDVGPDCAFSEDFKKDEDQEVTGVDSQNATEEQHEALSETEANTPHKEGNEENTVSIDQENEHTPVIITRSLRSGTKTTCISPSSRFRRENLKEKVETPTESVEEQNVTGPVEEAPELGAIIKEGENEAVAGVQIQAQADIGSIPEGSSGEDLSENTLPPLSDAQNINEALVDARITSQDIQDEPADAEESSPETVLSTNDDKANKNDILEKVDVPAPGSVASDLDDQQYTSEITPELLQDDEEDGCEAVGKTEGDEKEKEKPAVLPEEQCSSSVDLVSAEDTKTLVQQDENELARVEETPVEDSDVLQSSDNIVITTEEGAAMEIDEDESPAGKECVEDKLTVRTRKRQRSAATTPRRTSKRASRQSKKEEKEDSTSAEESQEEGPAAELQDQSGGEKTEENEALIEEVLTEDSSGREEHQEQEKEVSEDRNAIDESTVETRILRKRRSAAAATPRRTSKRVRSELKEAPKITEETSESEDKSVTAEAFIEELPIVPLMAQETQSVLLVTSEDEQKGTSDGEHSREEAATDEEKTADEEAPSGTQTKEDEEQGAEDVTSTIDPDVGPDGACTEEESPVLDMSEVTDDQVPTRTSRLLRSKTRASLTKPSHNSSRVEEQEEPQLHEDCVEDAKDVPLVESLAGDASEDQAEETVDLTSKSIADIADNPEENLESEEATSGSVEEDEDEDEWSMSEEELIVIGSRDLRGRTVPSLVITPHSTPRRRSAKVQVSEENRSPVHKKKTSSLKRRRV